MKTAALAGIDQKSRWDIIGSEMRMKNSAGEECVIKFLGRREGFHRVCPIDDSASEFAPLSGSDGLKFMFCPVIG